MYGAGDAKLGSIVAPTASTTTQSRKGKALRAKFYRAIPALRRLTEDVQSVAQKRGYLLGIDGRRLNIRSSHAALNTLLQSAGAVLMKYATVIFHLEACKAGLKLGEDYVQVLHVHKCLVVDVKPCELRETPLGQS